MGGLTEDDLARRYKVILSNPPYAGVLPKESIRKDLHTNAKKAEKAPDEDPAELIRETLAIERELENRLEKLLKDVEVAS